jgi:hypothetical protein
VEAKLIAEGKWCVPTALTARVVWELHSTRGHIGGERLMEAADRVRGPRRCSEGGRGYAE